MTAARCVPEIHGHCDERFALVRDAFAANFAIADEVGASFALTVDGECVIDLWAGHTDAAKAKPWQRDTLVNVYSTTKTMTALCALALADRRVIDLDAPVCRYWPEFAQNGKQAIEVRHLLSHSAGLPGLDVQVAEEDVYDWECMTTLLAAQRPWWEPGTRSGYHPVTQGHLIGEVVRRTTGMTLGTFFRRELAEPLDADFHIGLDPRHFERVGELIPPPGDEWSIPGDPDSISERAFRSPPISALASRTAAWRTAEIPAANGHGNARSVAKVQTLLANGGSAFGKRILSRRSCERVFEEQTNGTDLVLGIPIRFGLGYALSPEFLGSNSRVCYWGGWGGSLVVVDLDARVCFAYVMNRMSNETTGDLRGLALAATVYLSLDD
jgi:CubicO group peptidase (beta-lactamase class C family)